MSRDFQRGFGWGFIAGVAVCAIVAIVVALN